MSVERTGFEILMTADASGVVKGSKEASDALAGTADKTKDLNKDLGEGKEKLEEHGKGLHEAGQHSKLFGDKTHEAKEAVRALGESFEGVGKFARDLGSGTGLAIGLIGAGVAYLVQTWQAAGEEEAKFEKTLTEGAPGALEAQATAATNAATAHQKLADQLERSATGETSLLTAMQNRIKVFDDYVNGLEKVAKAEDEAEESKIHRQVSEKQISPEEGEGRIAEIRRNAAQLAAASDESKAQFRRDQEALVAPARPAATAWQALCNALAGPLQRAWHGLNRMSAPVRAARSLASCANPEMPGFPALPVSPGCSLSETT